MSLAVDTELVRSQADEAAREVADRARVVVRHLDAGADMADLVAASELFTSVWGASSETAPVAPELLRALSYNGNYVAAAFAGPMLVGAAVAFFCGNENGARQGKTSMHSHILGVLPDARSRGVGRAVKLHQRAWALGHGVETITWTFDPLVRRNAFFNLAKLGARGTTYLTDFYGVMRDGLNAGEESDRLLVSWELAGRLATEAAANDPVTPDVDADDEGVVLLEPDDDNRPRLARHHDGSASRWRVWIPSDIETLRQRQPEVARAWRLAVRDTLGDALAHDAELLGITRSGWYVLANPRESRHE